MRELFAVATLTWQTILLMDCESAGKIMKSMSEDMTNVENRMIWQTLTQPV
jgi:hypothetical protein